MPDEPTSPPPSRTELQRHLRMLKLRIGAQEDEIKRLRDDVQRLSASLLTLPEEEPVETEAPASAPAGVEPQRPEPELADVEPLPIIPPEIPLIIPAPQPVAATGIEIEDTPADSLPAPASPAIPGAAERHVELETRIGTYWFNRIGLALLVIGFALFARQIHAHLQPWHKVTILYLGAGVLFGVGKIWEEKLQAFARPVMAGGLSIAFLTSYAAHFVPATTCFSLMGSLTAMLASSAAMLFCAERWRSEATAGLAILLGHVAILVAGHDTGSFTTIAVLTLSITAVLLGIRHGWMLLNLVAVLAAFATHTIWSVQQAGAGENASAEFWLHFLSTTGYYAVFTFAAIRFQLGRGCDPIRLQESARRAVGPVAMVLYVSFVAWLFHSTTVYQAVIQWFLFPLAGVQLALTRFYQKQRSLDAEIYLAAAVVFFTLGLVAWLDGLTLNLALAAEALLLLIVSRSLDLWVLNPFAQVVLLSNFVHFWATDAHVITTWPAFLGTVASASVYFVKARLEETWEPRDPESSTSLPDWVARIRSIFDRLVYPLSHFHAAAGGILLAYQCQTFFGPAGDPIALAGFIVLLSGLTIMVRSIPWFWGVAMLQLVLIQQTIQANSLTPGAATSATQLWGAYQGAIGCVLAAALILIVVAPRRKSVILYLAGLLGLATSSCIIYFAASVGSPTPVLAFAGLMAPLVYWFVAEWLPELANLLAGDPLDSKPPGMLIEARRLARFPLRHAMAVVAGLLTHVVFLATLPSTVTAHGWLIGVSLMIVAATVLRGSTPSAMGLVVLLVLNLSDVFDIGVDSITTGLPPTLVWAISFCVIVIAATLSISGVRQRHSSFIAGSLALLIASMIAGAGLLFANTITFRPLLPWLFIGGTFWLIIETYHRGITIGGPWRNESLLPALLHRRTKLAMGLSVAGAAVLSGMLIQSINVQSTFWRAETALVIVFAIGTAILRSAPLAVAGATALIIAHLAHLGCEDQLIHPLWTILLLLTSLVGGVSSEWISRRPPEHWTLSARRALGAGGWYGALSTLGLGAWFANEWAGHLFDAPSLAIACQLLVAIPVAWIGARLLLPATGAATCALTAWVVLVTVDHTLWGTTFRPLLHVSTGLIAVQTILLERILARYPEALSDCRIQFPYLRKVYVIAGAILLLIGCHWAVEVRDAWTTLGWSVAALIYLGLGFLFRFSTYRRMALAIFIASIARIIVIDMAGLDPAYRIGAFLALGACLIGASFLYSRFKDEIREWL